ncbi:ASCH domain-containing protein [bacterium]|nr:ASCH domain-containing protein [bacterium]
MRKRLKFADPLVPLVLNGSKNTTWRINDDKDLQPTDILSLQKTDQTQFAEAKILWVKETTFSELTSEDKKGHEPFKSDEEMLKTYSKYYSMEVNLSTRLKVVKFKILN